MLQETTQTFASKVPSVSCTRCLVTPEPQSVFAATELFGQLCSQLGCFDKVTIETLFCLLQHFIRSDHADTRSQMAKLLRLMYANQSTKEKLRDSLSSKELGLTDEQKSRVMQEVFDARHMAGQVCGRETRQGRVQDQKTIPIPNTERHRLRLASKGCCLVSCFSSRPIFPNALARFTQPSREAAKDAERQPVSPVPGVAEGLATTLRPLLGTEEARMSEDFLDSSRCCSLSRGVEGRGFTSFLEDFEYLLTKARPSMRQVHVLASCVHAHINLAQHAMLVMLWGEGRERGFGLGAPSPSCPFFQDEAASRLLVLGRLARTVAPQLAQQGCEAAPFLQLLHDVCESSNPKNLLSIHGFKSLSMPS